MKLTPVHQIRVNMAVFARLKQIRHMQIVAARLMGIIPTVDHFAKSHSASKFWN